MSDEAGPGYERPPIALRRGSRRVVLAALAVAVILVAAIAKPWEGSTATRTSASVQPSRAAPGPTGPGVADVVPDLAAPSPGGVGDDGADPIAGGVWPAGAAAGGPGSASASDASIDGMLAEIARRAGDWGVADAGAGPRLIRDEPWFDWRSAVPVSAPPLPIEVGMWPGTDICDGVKDMLDRPIVVALTIPFHTDPTARVIGWWTDGTRVDTIDASVRDVTPPGDPGYRALVRTDATPWPHGRYELHLVSAGAHQAVSFCIHRTT